MHQLGGELQVPVSGRMSRVMSVPARVTGADGINRGKSQRSNRLLHLYAFASRQFPYQGEVAAPLLPDPVGFSMPCIPSQRTKASNQPVLVVSFGYIPKPWPPCS